MALAGGVGDDEDAPARGLLHHGVDAGGVEGNVVSVDVGDGGHRAGARSPRREVAEGLVVRDCYCHPDTVPPAVLQRTAINADSGGGGGCLLQSPRSVVSCRVEGELRVGGVVAVRPAADGGGDIMRYGGVLLFFLV